MQSSICNYAIIQRLQTANQSDYIKDEFMMCVSEV